MNVLYPMFVLVLLTLGVSMRLGLLRWRAVTAGEVDVAYYKTFQGDGEPAAVHVVSRHLSNLLELPLLFHLACLTAFITGQSGVTVVALAWAYALLRLVHSVIHLGTNDVLWRFRVFALSVFVLAALWLVLLAGLLAR